MLGRRHAPCKAVRTGSISGHNRDRRDFCKGTRPAASVHPMARPSLLKHPFMHPDELRRTQRHEGTGTLVDERSRQEVTVSYLIEVYETMAWVGEGNPRVKVGGEIRGRVWVPVDPYWARQHIGRNCRLTFMDGRKRLSFWILDEHGQIANNDPRGIYEAD
jgi:hypothetical protein